MAVLKYSGRAQELYLNTGTRFPRLLVWAMGLVKYSAAKANMDLGRLDGDRAKAIMEVALEVARGEHDDKIIVDVFQTGSGTGFNMNVNEVIASIAAERSGLEIHPNDHVNMSQSSNDTVPTAVRLAALKAAEELLQHLERLAKTLEDKAREWSGLVKPGRTHLRDALPVTFGQEVEAYAAAFRRDIEAVRHAMEQVKYVPLGGTAVGTGLNAPEGYDVLAVRILSEVSGIVLKPSETKMAQMRLLTDLLGLTGAMRVAAVDMWRLSQDLRLLFSGPNTGIAEIDMEVGVAGSSMMPGKVNPVTLEAVMQATSHVLGLDQSMLQASLLGELELSMGIPLAGYSTVRSASLLAEAARALYEKAIPMVRPRPERMRRLAEKSQALVTVLAPLIGYERAARISKEIEAGKSLEEAIEALGLPAELASLLRDLEGMTRPGVLADRVRGAGGGQ